jgi:hypothetical protein
MFVGENKDEPIGFVFASHENWSTEAHQFYDHVKNDAETPAEVKAKMGTVAFEDINSFVPLQAADHLAFETYHYRNDPPGSFRPAMNRLMDWPQNHGKHYDERSLLQYIELCQKEGLF